MALALLVALPLAALVLAFVINLSRVQEQPRRQATIPRKRKSDAERMAVDSAKSSPAAPDEQQQKGVEDSKTLATTSDAKAPTEKPSPPRESAAGQAGNGTQTPKPWQAALDSAGELPSYAKLAFLPFEEAFDRPDRDDLTPWFERTAGAGFRISKVPSPYGQSGTIEGVGRLLSPWPVDGVLRLQLNNFNRLKLHFFHGTAGVTLVYYEDQGYRWAAYATTRGAGKPTPSTWAITATDDDRCRRTEMRFGGPIELRCRGRELILSRGDVVLLTAPLAGPPSDVFFEGRATIHGIALARTKDAPVIRGREPIAENEAPARSTDTVSDSAPLDAGVLRLAELNWTATNPDLAKPQASADGSLQFAGEKLKQRAECFAPLPNSGLYEVVLELADVTPGAGVYLGREAGRPDEVVRFLRDKRSGQFAARLCGNDDQWEGDFDSPADKPVPLVPSHVWVRLLYGCGNVRWWLSSDGVHWAQTEPARDNAPPGVTSIGLQLVANRPDTRLTLKQITLRRLSGLSSLAKDDLIERSPAIAMVKSLAEWLPEAIKWKPAEIETAEWLRACTIRTLASGASRELAYLLLEALLDDAASRGLPLAQQLAALDDAALLALDLRDGQAMRVGVLSRYPQLGIRAADQSIRSPSRPAMRVPRTTREVPAWSSVRDAYHAVPIVTRQQMPVDLDRVIRWQLVSEAYRHEPEPTLDFLDRLQFFQQHRERPLVDWLESLARHDAPKRVVNDSITRLKESWREPLVEELNKETYNALTELKAVIEGQAWEDAARLVTSLRPQASAGVAPFVNERSLMTSLGVAVQLALEDYPPLRQALLDKGAPLAKLRISQAIHAGDAATIELATVQFADTPAAADAHRWLGDRALVAGLFARAIDQYQRARRISPTQGEELAPRIRLAAAMLGRDAGEPAKKTVQFGEVEMSAQEFESLVAEMRSRELAKAVAESSRHAASVPEPHQFATQIRSRLDGAVGDRPQEEVNRRTNQFRVPWADRQIATAIDNETLYVANHFQVAAYALASGQRLWQSETPPGQIQRAQEWTMIPMRPLVYGDRIFVRLLYSPNPLLVCLEKASGKLRWVAEIREREFLVSDPLMVQGQLVALGIALHPDQQGLLRLCRFDRDTGEMVREHDLVRLRNTWGARACCEVAEVEEGLVAVLGGATLAFDLAGNARWVRTHVTLPAEEDPRWLLQMYDRPIVHEGKLYFAQPGTRTVECLAAATGRRYWSAVLPEVVGVVGMADEVLVVRTEADLRGLDRSDGTTRWRYAASDLFSFQLLDSERLLLARRERVSNQNERWQTRLTWLDPAEGVATATTVLTELADGDPRLGPLVPQGDRLFTFFGRGQHDPTRELVELVPSGEAEQVLTPGDAWHERLHSMSKP